MAKVNAEINNEIKNKISNIQQQYGSGKKQIFAGQKEKIKACAELYAFVDNCIKDKKYAKACENLSEGKWNSKNVVRSVVDMVFPLEEGNEKSKKFNQQVTRAMNALICEKVKKKDAFDFMKKHTLKNLYNSKASKKTKKKTLIEGKFKNVILVDDDGVHFVMKGKRKKAKSLFNEHKTTSEVMIVEYDDEEDAKNGKYKVVESLINPKLEKAIRKLIKD